METSNTKNYTGDKIQNFFTAYVRQALWHNRVSYYRRYKAHQKFELLYNSEDQIAIHTNIHTDVSAISAERHSLDFDSIQMPGLAKELRKLPEKTFSIIRMRIVHGYSFKTIGAILDMKEEAVRVRYYRATKKIRNNMKEVPK